MCDNKHCSIHVTREEFGSSCSLTLNISFLSRCSTKTRDDVIVKSGGDSVNIDCKYIQVGQVQLSIYVSHAGYLLHVSAYLIRMNDSIKYDDNCMSG